MIIKFTAAVKARETELVAPRPPSRPCSPSVRLSVHGCLLTALVVPPPAAMGEYEPKIEVRFPAVLNVSKGSSVKLECFALGK